MSRKAPFPCPDLLCMYVSGATCTSAPVSRLHEPALPSAASPDKTIVSNTTTCYFRFPKSQHNAREETKNPFDQPALTPCLAGSPIARGKPLFSHQKGPFGTHSLGLDLSRFARYLPLSTLGAPLVDCFPRHSSCTSHPGGAFEQPDEDAKTVYNKGTTARPRPRKSALPHPIFRPATTMFRLLAAGQHRRLNLRHHYDPPSAVPVSVRRCLTLVLLAVFRPVGSIHV